MIQQSKIDFVKACSQNATLLLNVLQSQILLKQLYDIQGMGIGGTNAISINDINAAFPNGTSIDPNEIAVFINTISGLSTSALYNDLYTMTK